MSGAAAPAGLRVALRAPTRRLGGWRPRHPEWWLYAVAALGWAVLVLLQEGLVPSGSAAPSTPPGRGRVGHLGHAGGHVGLAAPGGASGAAQSSLVWGALAEHGVAALAMVAVMAPLVAGNVRFAALRSPRSQRRRVAGAVAGGWASVWVAGVAGLAVLAWLAVSLVGAPAAVLLATAVAVVWQWTSHKQVVLSRCHRVFAPPLVPSRSRRACRRYGRELGWSCLVSCAPMMALMTVAGHAVMVVAPLTGIAWYERRRRPHHDPARVGTSASLALVGGVTSLVTALGVI